MPVPDVRAMHLWFRYGAWPAKSRRRSRFGASGESAPECIFCLEADPPLLPLGCRCGHVVHWACFESAVLAALNPSGFGGSYKSWCKCPVCGLRYQGAFAERAAARWVGLAANGSPSHAEAVLSQAEHTASAGNYQAAVALYDQCKPFVVGVTLRHIMLSVAQCDMHLGHFPTAIAELRARFEGGDAGTRRRATGLYAEAVSLQAQDGLRRLRQPSVEEYGLISMNNGDWKLRDIASCYAALRSAVRMQRGLAAEIGISMPAELAAVPVSNGNTTGRDERKKELQYERLLALTRCAHARAALERHVPEPLRRDVASTVTAEAAYDEAARFASLAMGSQAAAGNHPLVLSLRHGRAMCSAQADVGGAETELRAIIQAYTLLYGNAQHPNVLQAQEDLDSLAGSTGAESSRAGAAPHDLDSPAGRTGAESSRARRPQELPRKRAREDRPESSRAGAERAERDAEREQRELDDDIQRANESEYHEEDPDV